MKLNPDELSEIVDKATKGNRENQEEFLESLEKIINSISFKSTATEFIELEVKSMIKRIEEQWSELSLKIMGKILEGYNAKE